MLKRQRKVSLLNIEFRGEDQDYTQAAIPLFPDQSGWTPENRSSAAYSIADIREVVDSGKLKIRARFQKSTPKGRIQVRTQNVPLHIKDIFTGEIFEKYPGQEALGNVKPSTIYFDDTSYSVFRGKHTFVPLTLEGVRFPELGVGIYDINWNWEYRYLDEEKSTEREDVWERRWRPLTLTQHRIFVILEKPNFPWTPYALPDYSRGLPFASPLSVPGLYFACEWAKGANSQQEAARMITDKLYASGRFVYDVNPHYFENKEANAETLIGAQPGTEGSIQAPMFHFRKVLERLAGGNGLGEQANCVDCALTVAALSNMLGCNLQVGRLQNSPNTDTADPNFFTDNRFEVNPIRAIGHKDSVESMQGLQDDGKAYFSFHAVAFESEGSEDEPGEFGAEGMKVYDACVTFVTEAHADGSESYASAAGLAFANKDETAGYQASLAADTPEGITRCQPQPVTVLRMQVY